MKKLPERYRPDRPVLCRLTRAIIKAVQWVRHAYQIPAPSPCDSGEISVADAARRLGCSPGVVYYWIENGQLAARRSPSGRLCIPWTPAIEANCHARIASSGHLNPAARRTRPRQRH
jgi:excisionase family DNA binding protein